MGVSATEFLGARPAEDGSWRFELGERIHGAFGGVFGGAVAAAAVMAARPAAPGRRPFSLHTTFVRGLATPECAAAVEVVSAGRTVTTVAVDLSDGSGKLAARSTVTFVASDALSPQDHAGRIPGPDLVSYEQGRTIRMGSGGNPPIVEVMQPRIVGEPAGGTAHAVRIPWDPERGAAAEAACMAADFCVGIPVGSALSEFVPIPNPDLSLRFAGEEAADVLVGVGRLARLDRGVAATQVEVWAGGSLLAVGLSSTVALGQGPPGPSGPPEREEGPSGPAEREAP